MLTVGRTRKKSILRSDACSQMMVVMVATVRNVPCSVCALDTREASTPVVHSDTLWVAVNHLDFCMRLEVQTLPTTTLVIFVFIRILRFEKMPTPLPP